MLEWRVTCKNCVALTAHNLRHGFATRFGHGGELGCCLGHSARLLNSGQIISTTLRRRLQTWRAGMIQVPDFVWNRGDPTDANTILRTKITWEAVYLHRTARDLESKPIWDTLQDLTAMTDFDPCNLLLMSTALLCKVAGPLVATPLGYGLIYWSLFHTPCYLRSELNPPLEMLVWKCSRSWIRWSIVISSDRQEVFRALEPVP